LELRIDLPENSYGASVRLRGEVKTRGRVQLYNEIDPSHVILITLAVLIRILPLTPREYHEATTQTTVKKTHRLVQTEMERRNATTWISPRADEIGMMKEEKEEERRREVAEIVENTIKRRLMMDDLPNQSVNLSEQVIEMRRSLRLLAKEDRNRREKDEDPPKPVATVPLTPPQSPRYTIRSSSSSSTASSSSTSTTIDSSSSSSTSSSTDISSSASISSQESIKPNLSPTSAYIHNLREKIIAEKK
ncbi:hypothetical protein PENTCL1PPCAC_11646, partial [Pristionchus entomophagus]